MKPTRACKTLLVAMGTVTLVLGLADRALAQTNEEIFEQFQFNFFPPGARASAMGQAFIGIADDASAAVTNPAGLVSLTRPQVYIEFKNTKLENARLAGADSLTTLQPTIFSTDVRSVSFLDVAAPVGSRATVAFTRHEFLNYQEEFELEPRPSPSGIAGRYLAPVDAGVDLTGVSYAGSVGVAVTNTFRMGMTISFNELKASTFSTRTGVVWAGGRVVSNGVITNESVIDDSSTAAAVSVGALFRPRDEFALGVLYAKGPSFTIAETFRAPSSTGALQVVEGFPIDLTIKTPDRLGVGVSVRPHPRLLVAADAVRIQYSQLAENLTAVLSSTTLTGSEFAIDDATEVHFGGEVLAVPGANPVFFRAGFLINPYHGLKYLNTSSDAATNRIFTALFNAGAGEQDAKVHGTLGGGVAVGRRFQLDLAYVWDRDLVVSAAVRF